MNAVRTFPFLFGGTFIEGLGKTISAVEDDHFPSFSEGLSLRANTHRLHYAARLDFPSFSEGLSLREVRLPGGARV